MATSVYNTIKSPITALSQEANTTPSAQAAFALSSYSATTYLSFFQKMIPLSLKEERLREVMRTTGISDEMLYTGGTTKSLSESKASLE
jgi:hypothetical protein